MLGAYRGFLEWLASDARFEFTRSDRLVDRLDGIERGDPRCRQSHG